MPLLPPIYINTVVAIGMENEKKEKSWIGTGFCFGKAVDTNVELSKRQYFIWIITNKHVLEGKKDVIIKVNSSDSISSKDYPIKLINENGQQIWTGHRDKEIDVAVLFINPKVLVNEKMTHNFFQSDIHILQKKKLKELMVSEGDRIFALGFPMGLVDIKRHYVICRGGCIARIKSCLDNRSKDFLIDAFVFPGNSGGPVILCPASISLEGTNVIKNSYLIGIKIIYTIYRYSYKPANRCSKNSFSREYWFFFS